MHHNNIDMKNVDTSTKFAASQYISTSRTEIIEKKLIAQNRKELVPTIINIHENV